SACASARPDANHSERQRCLVTGNDHIRGVALTVTIEKRPYRIPAEIHEGLRFYEQYLLPGQRDFGDLASRFVAKTASACALKQSVNEHKPEIMPGHFILSPGIPESHNKLHKSVCSWQCAIGSCCPLPAAHCLLFFVSLALLDHLRLGCSFDLTFWNHRGNRWLFDHSRCK